MQKKKPLRKCMACNNSREKHELIRIVKPKEEKVDIDLTGKKSGRGAYICKSEECLNNIIKTKKLERIFETEIDNEIYEKLRGVIIESNK